MPSSGRSPSTSGSPSSSRGPPSRGRPFRTVGCLPQLVDAHASDVLHDHIRRKQAMNQPTCRSPSPGLAADCSSRAKEVAVGGGGGALVRVRRVPGVEQGDLATPDDMRLADASSWDASPIARPSRCAAEPGAWCALSCSRPVMPMCGRPGVTEATGDPEAAVQSVRRRAATSFLRGEATAVRGPLRLSQPPSEGAP